MADFSLGIDFDRLVKEGANDLGDAFGKVAGAAGNGLERIASLGRAGTSDTIGRIAGYGGRGGGDTLARISQYGGYGGGGNLDFFSQMGGTDPFAAFNRTQANMAALTPPPAEKPLTVPTGAGGGATGAAPLGSAQWADKINQHAAKYADAPEMAEVVQALMELESGGNANAQGVVVTQGAYAGQRAQGLMQIMPGNYPGVNLMDPDTNIQKGMEMLYERFKRYGNWDSAVASYFGAVDANGRPTTAADDNGTTGIQYVAIINGHRQTIRQSRPVAAGGTPTGQAVDPQGYSFPVVDYRGSIALHWGEDQGAADIFAAPGTAVVAMRGGQVTSAGWSDLGGWNLTIVGDDGLSYYYAHLQSAPAVRAGQQVGAGVLIGQVGDTGNAKGTGAHLHLGIGHGIQSGTGARGGSGVNFNATALLQQVYQNHYARPATGGGNTQR